MNMFSKVGSFLSGSLHWLKLASGTKSSHCISFDIAFLISQLYHFYVIVFFLPRLLFSLSLSLSTLISHGLSSELKLEHSLNLVINHGGVLALRTINSSLQIITQFLRAWMCLNTSLYLRDKTKHVKKRLLNTFFYSYCSVVCQ